jgi:glycosyltransferase involved in cell wall biosynthesis
VTRARRAPVVAIDGRAALRARIGGVERLAREMSARLPALAPERYRVLSPPAVLAHRAGHVWEQTILPTLTSRYSLLYCPANLAPVVSRERNVVVIHDAAAIRHPESYSRSYVAYQRVVLPRIARRARLLITVSQFSKRELVEVLGAAPERVVVIPEGVGERFAAGIDPAPTLLRYGLRDYVLVVGTISARKNLGVLGAAARALSERGIELVLAGSARPYLRGPSAPLRRLGYVRDEDLPALYAGARALAMPSVYEGFGLPCLEAMACGTPVVASSAGALPETVADAGLLVESRDGAGFADALLAAASDEAVRARLVELGLRRAAAYTWTRTAELTDAAIGELLGVA